MELEKEIQQKSFKNRQAKLAVNLLYSSNWMNAYYQKSFKESGLSYQQYNVLRILRGQYPNYCTLKLIKERMLDRMSDASRIVDKLVAKKYASRNQCPNDRRSVSILISEKGLQLLKELDNLDDSLEVIFKTLTPNEIDELNLLLDKMRG